MAIVGTTIKQPDETFPIAVDFAAALDSTESVSSATVTARLKTSGVDATATLLTGSPAISANSDGITSVVTQQLAADGDSGTQYIVQFHATTSLSNQYEDEVVVVVKEF